MADFVKVCSTTDVQQGKMKVAQLGNEKVCLANVNGKYYAIGDVCTHVGGPLSEGSLTDHTVTCPWHGSQFDVRTGETLWQTRLGTSVQGYPVSFSVGGRQYIAVTTGRGGLESPRLVPRTLAPELKYPQNGNALYVFSLK